ncbi:dienelactone hydrolase family protein [Planctomicrobium sp. SH664]|uniref:dienelactone hydrolase family protein n=1 Tax=Planctomicrobium sp. SH664 TaxID=3448125 RepID=UPI003F5AFD03
MSLISRSGFSALFVWNLMMLSTMPAAAADLNWLATALTAPNDVPSPSRPLQPLLRTAEGRTITTEQEWQPVAADLKKKWLEFLGPLPPQQAELEIKVLQTDELENVTRQLLEYNTEQGRRVQAYVVRPRETTVTPRPGLVVFHGTTPDVSRSDVGLGTVKPGRDIGLKLAERGYVVICPNNYLWEESTYLKAVAAARKRNPESLGMATMVADGMRAVDVLLTLPGVDAKQLGTIGHSLGAKEALYLTALDDRIQAGVASEGGLGLDSTNWEADWYLGKAIQSPDFPRNHHELVALIAPRPFLVLGGETGKGCADGKRSWPYIEVGQQVSRLYGVEPRQALLIHNEGHLYSPESQNKSFDWLEHFLPTKSPSPAGW